MIVKNLDVAVVAECLGKEECKIKTLEDGFKVFEFSSVEAEQVIEDYYYALRNDNCFYIDAIEYIDKKKKLHKRIKAGE